MRISDWSSDVCSSDLPRLLSAQEAELRRCPRLHDEEQRVRASRQTLMQEAAKWGYTRVRLDQSGSAQWLFASWNAAQAVTREKRCSGKDRGSHGHDTGNALCRERGCQEV